MRNLKQIIEEAKSPVVEWLSDGGLEDELCGVSLRHGHLALHCVIKVRQAKGGKGGGRVVVRGIVERVVDGERQ